MTLTIAIKTLRDEDPSFSEILYDLKIEILQKYYIWDHRGRYTLFSINEINSKDELYLKLKYSKQFSVINALPWEKITSIIDKVGF